MVCPRIFPLPKKEVALKVKCVFDMTCLVVAEKPFI